MAKDQAKSMPVMPNTFHLFTALPRELRDLIWAHTLPSPRIIPVGCKSLPPRIYADVEPPINTPWPTFGGCFEPGNPSPPTLLHSCRESRMVALARFEMCLSYTPPATEKYYEKSLYIVQHGTLRKPADKAIDRQQLSSHGIWFQPLFDTIYFPNDGMHDEVSLAAIYNSNGIGTRNIRSFAFDDRMYHDRCLEIIFKHFPGVCKVFVVLLGALVPDNLLEKYYQEREKILKKDLVAMRRSYPHAPLECALVWRTDFMSPDFQTRAMRGDVKLL